MGFYRINAMEEKFKRRRFILTVKLVCRPKIILTSLLMPRINANENKYIWT